MSATQIQPALPLRSHTILGVCEGIGEDFGFNPLLLRVPLATIVLFSPMLAIGAYLALGLGVLAARLIFPAPKAIAADAAPAAAAPVAVERADEELQLAA